MLFYHSLSNSYIRTGGDCAEKLEMGYGDLDAFKNAARHAMGISKGKRAAVAKWEQAGLGDALEIALAGRSLPAIEWPAEMMDSDEYERKCAVCRAQAREISKRWESGYKLGDMLKTTEMYGTLSDKMIEAAKRLATKHAAYEVLAVERTAEKAAAAPCPTGRVTITGTIVKVDDRESQWGLTTKMLVKAAEGFMIWSTLPSGAPCERGAEITFKATVKPSPDDPKFGFASRPIFAAA